jgi:hypothetical protein
MIPPDVDTTRLLVRERQARLRGAWQEPNVAGENVAESRAARASSRVAWVRLAWLRFPRVRPA